MLPATTVRRGLWVCLVTTVFVAHPHRAILADDCAQLQQRLVQINTQISNLERDPNHDPQALEALIRRRDETAAELRTCSLPLGLWQINGNGFPGQLRIDSLDTQGAVRGAFIDSDMGTPRNLPLVNASWNHDARRLTFTRALPNGENQTFTGFLFDNPTGASTRTIAGTFTGDRFEDPNRPAFGWFAQIRF